MPIGQEFGTRATLRNVARCATFSTEGGMIRSWASDQARAVFEGHTPKGFPPELARKTRRVLAQLNAAISVEDMRLPPGNRLHALNGDRAGQWSVSVNDQFRITFVWGAAGPEQVWFGDYH